MKKLFKLLTFFVIYTAYSILHTNPVFAQNNNSLNITLSPSVIELVADPNSTVHQIFRVRNNNTTAMNLKVTVEKLNGNVTDSTPYPTAITKADTYISWLNLDKNTFKANPNEWTDIKLNLDIPSNAAFGYYYALVISQDTSTKTNGPAAKLVGQVVLPILLNVKSPNAKPQLQLLSFNTTNNLNEYLPVNFSIKIKNPGNVHLTPAGNIFIRGAGDSELGVLDLNPDQGTILPGETRIFNSSWDDGFITREPVMQDDSPKLDSNGKVVTHLVFNWNKLTSFRIGKYTATALLVYDNGKSDVPLEATTTFWVFPYTFVISCVSVLIILIILTRLMLKAYIKSQIKKYQK